jgi:capsular exopolysaccharide synthesis family protein
MEIRTYVTIMLRRWWVIVLVTLLVTAASYYISKRTPPSYQAETDLRIVTPLGGSLGDVSYQSTYADRLLNTYVQIGSSDRVTAEVMEKLDLTEKPDISVKTIANSEIINISVKGTDPVIVAKTANMMAETIIAIGQESSDSSDTTTQNLDILTTRQSALQKELDQIKQEREKQVEAYAQITAQMNPLDRDIQMKQDEYQSLQSQYEQASIAEVTAIYPATKTQAKTTKDFLSAQMDTIGTQMEPMKAQYQDLLAKATAYSQSITALGQTIESRESAYNSLLTQIDTLKIANVKRENSQDLVIASPAVTPLKPSGPGKILIVGLGFLIGGIGGILLAFLWNSLDTRILSVEQVRSLTRLPILGTIPRLNRRDRLDPSSSTDFSVQRACGIFCAKILAVQQSRPFRTMMVTSPNPAEGKSTIILALAEALAKANRKVLVVDTDLRKSKLVQMFHASTEKHLAGVLCGDYPLAEAVQALAASRVHFLAGAPEIGDPAIVFQSPEFAEFLKNLAGYDVVLLDTPAALSVPDAAEISMLVDGIMLVVLWKRTLVEDIQAMATQLEDENTKLLGTVINRIPQRRVSGYYSRKPLKFPRVTLPFPGSAKSGQS